MVRNLLDRLYGRSRGLNVGFDQRLSNATVSFWIAGKVVMRLRGLLRGRPRTYFGRSVKISNPSLLELGAGSSIGDRVVIDALAVRGVTFGPSCTIDVGAVLRGTGVIRDMGEGIKVGARTAIGVQNVILGQGGITIGDDCLLGPNVSIFSENHRFDQPSVPIRQQGEVRLPTTVGNNVWIGAGAIILGGATIGDGAIVAAGSVVRGHVPPMSIVAGIPARVVRERVRND